MNIAKELEKHAGEELKLALTSEKAEEMLRAARDCEALGEYAIAEDVREILRQEQEHLIDLATALGEARPIFLSRAAHDVDWELDLSLRNSSMMFWLAFIRRSLHVSDTQRRSCLSRGAPAPMIMADKHLKEPRRAGRPPAGAKEGEKVKDYPQLSIRVPIEFKAHLNALSAVTGLAQMAHHRTPAPGG